MGRPKKANNVEVGIDTPAPVEPAVVPAEKPVVKFPQVARNGKYQAVKVGAEYVVYNPDGARVSGLLPLQEANDIVRDQNRAAHL